MTPKALSKDNASQTLPTTLSASHNEGIIRNI